MHKYELLRLRAEEFRTALEGYAKLDPDVADFLERWIPWYERIQRREIRLPCYDYKLDIYFTNPDLSPLAERYGFSNIPNELFSAGTRFVIALTDWLSNPKYVAQRIDAGEPPDLIPDEPPPPEEDAPLPTPLELAPKGFSGWLYKVIFGSKPQ
jgi:hypothetical protein